MLYENRFGTVEIDVGGATYQVTTYRHDGAYSDHRRPDEVVFGERLDDDLARRDFTVNAMALAIVEEAGGTGPGPGSPTDGAANPFVDPAAIRDPFGGRADLAPESSAPSATRPRVPRGCPPDVARGSLRGHARVRIEPRTLAAIAENAALARSLSGERVLAEPITLLAAPVPSVGLRLSQETGLLAAIAPELARQRGVPQGKVPGEDLWDHTCRTVYAVPQPARDEPPLLRLAAFLHDIGKPATFADGDFVGHGRSATLGKAWLTELHAPRFLTMDPREPGPPPHVRLRPRLDRCGGTPFIRRCGASAVEDVLDLGPPTTSGVGSPRTRMTWSRCARAATPSSRARVALDLPDLAVNGSDLMQALDIAAGPAVGSLLDHLLELVMVDPMLNDRSPCSPCSRAGRAELPAPGEPLDAGAASEGTDPA